VTRLYQRSRDDQINACKRCLSDAHNGRVSTAFDRLADLADEGPHDAETKAEMIYVEGVVRRDYLGQGFAARALFEEAYHVHPGHFYAVINAAQLARHKAECDVWCETFRAVVPASESQAHQHLASRREALQSGTEYWELLHDLALIHKDGAEFGQAASLMELALADHRLPVGEEPGKRRWRAQMLRSIDEQAEILRTTNREHFPADERLSLLEATRELDRAIALDEYDAEIWNLKAAWCRMLGRFEEAEQAADKAIGLRPHGYAKPHINKTQALFRLGKRREAAISAEEALRQAREAGDAADVQHAEELVTTCSRPETSPSLADLRPVFDRILQGAIRLAEDERAEDRQQDFAMLGFFNRCRKLHGSASGAFVPIVAELLSDFRPERAFQIISNIPRVPSQLPGVPTALAQQCYDHCLHAILYVTVHSDGVRRRDAARLLCLIIFGAIKPELIRRTYREAILATSAAADDAMSGLDAIMREELGRIHPKFPQLIADQEPVTDVERDRARRTILSRFASAGGSPAQATPSGIGCSGAVVACVLVAAGIALCYWLGLR